MDTFNWRPGNMMREENKDEGERLGYLGQQWKGKGKGEERQNKGSNLLDRIISFISYHTVPSVRCQSQPISLTVYTSVSSLMRDPVRYSRICLGILLRCSVIRDVKVGVKV